MKETTVRIIDGNELKNIFEVYFGEKYDDVEIIFFENEDNNLVVEKVRLFRS